MILELVWLFKLLLSHLITDFLLQSKSWIEDRRKNHFLSGKLYLHGGITALLALIFLGIHYWLVIMILLITHILIDGWKSFKPDTIRYFLIDQLFHIMVIAGCWFFVFFHGVDLETYWHQLNSRVAFWETITAFIFLTTPSAILIGKFTKSWREKIEGGEGLAHAGKWIGITERIIILVFVLQNQYAAIGLLIAAKGIIRFNEKDRPEIKTEYLVIGTLMSMALAILTGLMLKL